MNQYLVVFRNDVDVGSDAITVSAHRVEGWQSDYAFFGHPRRLGQVTHLYPKEVVRNVKMTHFEGDDGRNLEEEKRRVAGLSSDD